MIKLSLIEIAGRLNEKILVNDSNASNNSNLIDPTISFVCTDTRAIKCKSKKENKGTLFVAIKGPHFDAHQFLLEVQTLGVSALIVEDLFAEGISIPQIQVKDTRVALAMISKLVGEKSTAKTIAVTGSCGKTTVKEMIASILKQNGETFSTIGNFNNSIGVPLSLLELKETTEFAVLELGASQTGEITFTADLVKPDVALVNNISASHLEGFGDLQGVAQAKNEIYASLSSNGIAVVNLDDDFAKYFIQRSSSKVMTFSSCDANDYDVKPDVYAQGIKLDDEHRASFELVYKEEKISINLPLVGKHNISNALAAASCCLAIGFSLETIAKGLSKVESVNGRLNIYYHSSGCKIIDDTYNANLDSIKAAINLLSEYESTKILVLGDMAELGAHAKKAHEEVGRFAFDKNIDQLYTYGEFTKLTQKAFKSDVSLVGKHFQSHSDLTKKLLSELNNKTTILIKGSRSSHMERIVQDIMTTDKINNKKIDSTANKEQKVIVEGEL